jgi:hypothetical protein|tara:strand:+ start:2101 stop:2400 length:300 start_codon:yes stop_codon:yes gene_type:complete
MKKVLLNIIVLIFLSGCFQSTAMIGPGVTLASTGNISQAFTTYLTNKAVEKETGMQTHQFIAKKVEEQKMKNKRKNIPEGLIILLENNLKKTRSIIKSN